MNKILKALKKVAKELNLDPKKAEAVGDRYYLSDGFTTILAAKEEVHIKLWAESHKKFVDDSWERVKSGKFTTKNSYQRVVTDKLKLCKRKPEIDIVYETNLDGIEVVVYTDTIDTMVAEAEQFKGI